MQIYFRIIFNLNLHICILNRIFNIKVNLTKALSDLLFKPSLKSIVKLSILSRLQFNDQAKKCTM